MFRQSPSPLPPPLQLAPDALLEEPESCAPAGSAASRHVTAARTTILTIAFIGRPSDRDRSRRAHTKVHPPGPGEESGRTVHRAVSCDGGYHRSPRPSQAKK